MPKSSCSVRIIAGGQAAPPIVVVSSVEKRKPLPWVLFVLTLLGGAGAAYFAGCLKAESVVAAGTCCTIRFTGQNTKLSFIANRLDSVNVSCWPSTRLLE